MQARDPLASELAVAFEPFGITPRGHSALAAATTGGHTQKALVGVVAVDNSTSSIWSSRDSIDH